MNGYVKLHRKLVEWGWYSDRVVKDVFIHLLMVAAFKPGQYLGHEIKPGQAIIGLQKLSKELGFSIQQVRTALKKLESTGEITLFSTNKFTIATVENWEFYQCDDEDSNKRATNEQQTNNKRATNEQQHLKNVKNVNNNNIYNMQNHHANDLFERLWKVYPVKRGKGQVSEAKKKALLTVGEEQMLRAIDRYLDELKSDDWRKPQNGSTFFNSGYVDYLDDNYQPKESERKKYDFKP